MHTHTEWVWLWLYGYMTIWQCWQGWQWWWCGWWWHAQILFKFQAYTYLCRNLFHTKQKSEGKKSQFQICICNINYSRIFNKTKLLNSCHIVGLLYESLIFPLYTYITAHIQQSDRHTASSISVMVKKSTPQIR